MSAASKPKHLAYVPVDKLIGLKVWNSDRTLQGTVSTVWVGTFQEIWVRIEWFNGSVSSKEQQECTKLLTVEPI